MVANKRLGQHFLRDRRLLARFVSRCRVEKSDAVLEIGGGTGIITAELAKLAERLTVVELDRNLVAGYLLPLAKRFPNLTVVNADILSFLDSPRAVGCQKIVGAIPYQITSPLLAKLVSVFYSLPDRPKIVLVTQWELALRVTASPPRATFLSNLVSLYGRAEVAGGKIAPQSFSPQPKVDSAILKITPERRSDLVPERLDAFVRFLHHGFKNPRKMLKHAFDERNLLASGISPSARPQEVPLSAWLALFKKTR